jgi:hypothetical protein
LRPVFGVRGEGGERQESDGSEGFHARNDGSN